MNTNQTCLERHKHHKLSLCFSLFLLLSFLGIVSTTLVACGTDKDILARKDTTSTDTSKVIVLKSADIKDYAKYYKPQEFKDMDMLRSDSKWSFVRSKQSAHFIIFWAAGFGKDPNASTVPNAMRVDVDH